MVALTVRPLTYKDLDETPDDGRWYEILSGEMIVSPAPILKHQELVTRLAVLFYNFVVAHRLGVVYGAAPNVRLSPYDIVQPDIVYVSEGRAAILQGLMIEGAPDLVVEVFSPSTRQLDQARKAATYAAFGVREYWMVDPELESIVVQELVDRAYRLVPQEAGFARSVVLDGLVVDVAALFAGLR